MTEAEPINEWIRESYVMSFWGEDIIYLTYDKKKTFLILLDFEARRLKI